MEHVFERIEGWFSWRRLYDQVIASAPADTPSCIVELGCWKGRSTAYLGVEVINSGKPITLVIVDWFKNVWPETDVPHTTPVVEEFFRNLAPVAEQLLDRFRVIPGNTNDVAKWFTPPAPVHAICVDAGHDYQSVMGDLAGWWPHLTPGGVMLGDDYEPLRFPDVVRAVDDFFGVLRLPVETRIGDEGWPAFWVQKPA